MYYWSPLRALSAHFGPLWRKILFPKLAPSLAPTPKKEGRVTKDVFLRCGKCYMFFGAEYCFGSQRRSPLLFFLAEYWFCSQSGPPYCFCSQSIVFARRAVHPILFARRVLFWLAEWCALFFLLAEYSFGSQRRATVLVLLADY